MRLQAKSALITCAGSGIGRATALLFAREGASVLAATLDPADLPLLEGEARGLPGAIRGLQADITREDDVRRAVSEAAGAFGGLDILVNNAATVLHGTVTDTSDEDWNTLLDVNLRGAFLCCRHAVPEMRKRGGGAIVNVSSINGIRGNNRLVAYCASKGGVVALSMALAIDHAAEGIRVNCVCPATIAPTRMHDASLSQAADPDDLARALLAKHPMGRYGRPEEVAAAILFLASDEASFITGVTLPVDGGRSIR
jgi:NAD(P)-dependent dehydrogenase (short-subunit alcohol dehydrogenase family)